jgi:chemotaxis regulatin CheY-phosphate phosphatase CheZ
MTQEELDALMDGGVDEEVAVLDEPQELELETQEIKEEEAEIEAPEEEACENLPPPPTEEHQVVSQLDDVTKDSEIKASEIFDKLEEISAFVGDTEEITANVSTTIQNNIEMLEKLCVKFPNVESFKTSLEQNKEALAQSEEIVQKSQNSGDEIMMIMDIMQYQDIHRQKIERVINVMRALSKYMNSLFASDTDDKNRASVAQHIDGDATETVSEDDIEALLESFGKK